MAIEFISLAGSDGSGYTPPVSTRASGAFAAVSGNAILVLTSNYTEGGGRAVSGVSDTAGNMYMYCGSGGGEANHTLEVWLALNITGHASNVVTVAFASSATFALMVCAQYSGIATSGAVDDISAVTLTPDDFSHTTQEVTASTASALVVGFFVPWIIEEITDASAPNTYRGSFATAAVVDRIVAAAGDYSIQALSPRSVDSSQAAVAVALKGASGGGTARNLIAALTGESATGTISAIVARALTGDVTATSITGAITASMARDLLASLAGASAAGDIVATLQRLLLASLGGASTAGDVSATTARALIADLQAESTTPDIAATLAALVALTANISGTTTTPAVAATMARALAANLAGQSTAGAITVEFAGMLLLVASIAGTSTTGALTATTGRELRAAIATASTTGQVDGQLLRQIAATIAGASLTGSIAAELVNLVSLAASVVGVSLTPAVVATISRDLAAEVAAGSTTGAASATVARTLAAAVDAGSLTPDNLVLILTGLGILHDTTIISRTPRRGISSRTVRRTLHSA